MNNLVLDDLLNLVKKYNPDEIENVKKAYFFAEKFHEGQKRQSGEPYIVHPLNVAYNLAKMHADGATLCAGLLHDVLEDTPVTEEELSSEFGADVCNLVLGVTKISNIHFVKSDDIIMENTRKIITSLKDDVRIIIVKLADRLHNMSTLDFKAPDKQKKHSKETMEIFVPIAYHIGAYLLKEELEDLCLKYLDEKDYNEIKNQKESFKKLSTYCVNDMVNQISSKIDFNYEIFIRDLNLTGIFKRLNKGYKFEEIHNIISLVMCVDNEADCYKALGIVHNLYHPVNHKFKDYICNPKTNMYKSLHTTVFGENDTLVQVQIRTFEMDQMACMGLLSYWKASEGLAGKLMKEDLKQKYQFFSDLLDLDESLGDNYQFVNIVKDEVLNDKIYCYSPLGKVVELPKGSTPIDFAYKIHTEIGNKMVSAIVNDNPVEADYVLKNKDRVRIITDDSSFDKSDWEERAHTSYAKRKIKESLREDI